MKIIRKISISILLILFTAWIFISCLRTIYNFSKLFTEEVAWYGLNSQQQKSKQFKELDSLYNFVKNKTKRGSTIKLFTNNIKAYYLGRYYLYPTKIISKYEISLWENKNIKYDYILFYDYDQKIQKNIINKYLKNPQSFTLRNKNSKIVGILYKL